ncbi:hypothetical protein [Synechococcus sp. MIT S1220]|uniref:hypothetical protein n=1 Tax=Synechococcus sp. MIT S1220 TaxID=3082549 RepID=UPI0039B10AE1
MKASPKKEGSELRIIDALITTALTLNLQKNRRATHALFDCVNQTKTDANEMRPDSQETSRTGRPKQTSEPKVQTPPRGTNTFTVLYQLGVLRTQPTPNIETEQQ